MSKGLGLKKGDVLVTLEWHKNELKKQREEIKELMIFNGVSVKLAFNIIKAYEVKK